jgi:hypothetical protein
MELPLSEASLELMLEQIASSQNIGWFVKDIKERLEHFKTNYNSDSLPESGKKSGLPKSKGIRRAVLIKCDWAYIKPLQEALYYRLSRDLLNEEQTGAVDSLMNEIIDLENYLKMHSPSWHHKIIASLFF